MFYLEINFCKILLDTLKPKNIVVVGFFLGFIVSGKTLKKSTSGHNIGSYVDIPYDSLRYDSFPLDFLMTRLF